MPATSILTIVFRGLMVCHEDKSNGLFEIGILNEPVHHIPRILTLKNGVLAGVKDLREHNEPSPWTLVVRNPMQNGVSIRRGGPDKFFRLSHPFRDDFRWIMDLEGEEFYDKELSEIKTSLLAPILKVSQGEFYTRLPSPKLDRSTDDNDPEEFGKVAAVVGCDIPDNGRGASLTAADGTEIFRFENENDIMYEIANTPPDIASDHDRSKSNLKPDDHFQHYYKLFEPSNKPRPIFHLVPPPFTVRDPDPAVCGLIMMGKRECSLEG